MLGIQRCHLLGDLGVGLGFGSVSAVLLRLGLLNGHLGLGLRLLNLLLGFHLRLLGLLLLSQVVLHLLLGWY